MPFCILNSRIASKQVLSTVQKQTEETIATNEVEMTAIMEENEGLRKGLQEIFDFLKDNSKFVIHCG